LINQEDMMDPHVPYDRTDPLTAALATAPREATALRQHLLDSGYVVLPTPREGDSLHGVPCWDDPETLLSMFMPWLAGKGLLVDPPAGAVDDDYDVVLHFLSDQREAAEKLDQELAAEADRRELDEQEAVAHASRAVEDRDKQ
jgi:hypothetical protein